MALQPTAPGDLRPVDAAEAGTADHEAELPPTELGYEAADPALLARLWGVALLEPRP